MSKVKVCRVCGERNSADAFDCRGCGELLIGSPQEDAPAQEAGAQRHHQAGAGQDPSATIIDRRRVLHLEAADGSWTLDVRSGAVVGREGVGKEWLARCPTVSRRHARLAHDGTRWTVEDLGSTNGTWVDGRRIEPGTPCPIGPGGTVALSRACVLRVGGDAS